MYRELIQRLSSDIKWVKLGDGCTESEIDLAESAVGYPFPGELRDLLSEVNGDGGWLLMSVDEIIAMAEWFRDEWRQFFEAEGKMDKFAENIERFIFFALDGCGGYYGYHVDSDGKPEGTDIYYWDHEALDQDKCFSKVANNLEEFVNEYYN